MKTDVIDKIAKLLNLAEGKGTTPGEAAAAAAQANRLMFRHQLTRAEVEQSTEAADEPIDRGELWDEKARRLPSWVSRLAASVASLHCCRAIIVSSGFSTRIDVIGSETDAAVVRYVFTYLRREIDRLARTAACPAGVTPRTFRNDFRHGAVAEVFRRLRADRAKQRRAAPCGSTAALVLIDRRDLAVEQKRDEITGGKQHRSAGPRYAEGFVAGRQAATRIALHDALGSEEEAPSALGGGR